MCGLACMSSMDLNLIILGLLASFGFPFPRNHISILPTYTWMQSVPEIMHDNVSSLLSECLWAFSSLL